MMFCSAFNKLKIHKKLIAEWLNYGSPGAPSRCG